MTELTQDERHRRELDRKLLEDREWRLDHLYRIRDEDGHTIPFVRNAPQRAFDKAMWYRNVLPKARKLGFSTYIAVFILDECLFNSGTLAGITDKTIPDAEDKLAMIRFAYEGLPERLQRTRKLVRANDKYLEFDNGSAVSVGLTYRGGTPRILHCSELGKVSVDTPEQAREIRTGAIQAVPKSGFVFVESTAHGTNGVFAELVNKAEALRLAGSPLTQLDFKSHFFGWWAKPEYRLPNHLVVVTQELKEYFAELREKHGLTVDADQMAWYAKKHDELGPDDVKQEFPSVRSELFFASLQGAYWKKEMLRARQDQRVGQPVPHDPSRPVNTFWDIGEDGTAIIFHQSDGVRHRIIDYYEEEGGSVQSACAAVEEKRRARGFVMGEHYFPHDIDRRVWDLKAINRKVIAEELLGKKITVVPRIEDKADSIEAARRMLAMTWIDQVHCGRLVDAFDNYRKKWNDRMGCFMAEPVHDWASHPADAYQQGARGLKPEKAPKDRSGRHSLAPPSRTTSWAQ